jgi:hypothetical protein
LKPQYLRVRNWETFQHYTNRRPPWIKYHVSILDDHQLLSLSPMTQLVYDRLLLRAALTDNNVEHDPVWLAQKFNLPAEDIQRSIETLIETGFLAVSGAKRSASKAIAKRKQSKPSRGGTETEAEAEAEAYPDVSDAREREQPTVCKFCEVGGGKHAADCPSVSPTLRSVA